MVSLHLAHLPQIFLPIKRHRKLIFAVLLKPHQKFGKKFYKRIFLIKFEVTKLSKVKGCEGISALIFLSLPVMLTITFLGCSLKYSRDSVITWRGVDTQTYKFRGLIRVVWEICILVISRAHHSHWICVIIKAWLWAFICDYEKRHDNFLLSNLPPLFLKCSE
jgi:hypothetical protein